MWLSAKEYGELCHAIRNKFANRIDSEGFILYKNHLYMYTFDRELQRIYCYRKIEIDRNEDVIDIVIRRFEDGKKIE